MRTLFMARRRRSKGAVYGMMHGMMPWAIAAATEEHSEGSQQKLRARSCSPHGQRL